ncbi:MAG: helix-turn-helix transcriptional regulator [Marinoscillum sp.]
MEKSVDHIISVLSPREKEILTLISNGKSRVLISQQLNISKLTYDGYRKSIRNKLGLRNPADWVRILYEVSHQE